MSNIKMRNIVEIKDVISEKGYLVIVMEYCSNLNLVNYINKHKNDSNEEKIIINHTGNFNRNDSMWL